jgi:serine protease Do
MVNSSSRFFRKGKWGSLIAAGSLAAGLVINAVPVSAATNYDNNYGGGDPVAGKQELLNMQAALISIARKVEPAVVHIQATISPSRGNAPQDGMDNEDNKDNRDNGDEPGIPLFPFGSGPQGPAPRSGPGLASGSGVIIDPKGVIITNRHVVENAANVTVTLTDHRIYKGTVYSDPNVDLAVVQIHPQEDLPYVRLADSNNLQIGEWVFAIGYPFNVGETVSKGIISALGRSQTIEGKFYPNLVQTDASINPGNSGGALVDINGDVIGINTAIAGAAGQSAGIGFAIPSSTVSQVYTQLAGPEHRITNYPRGWVRGKLGVEVRPVTPDLFNTLGVEQGALIASVQPGSPAATAGVEAGDVITRVNDVPVRDADELVDAISNVGPDQAVTLSIVRDKRHITRTVTTGSYNQTTATTAPTGGGRLGLRVSPVTPQLRQEMNIPNSVHEGVVVTSVRQGSPADDAGFQQGDVIYQVNGTPVNSTDDFSAAVAGAHPGDSLGVKVYRGDTSNFLVIQIPDNQK